MIAPADVPEWVVTPDALQEALRSRWPEAGFYAAVADFPMAVTAEVAYPEGQLQVNLDREGTLLSLDAPSLTSAADFAAWWATRAPGLEPDVRIYVTAEHGRSAALRRDISADEVSTALAP